jgi:hypothetical protein
MVPGAIFDDIDEQMSRHAANLIFGSNPSRPVVDLLVVEVTPGKHIAFDTEAVTLLKLAEDALGRMFYSMRRQLGSQIKVGPILLKRFERAVESFDQFQKRRLN